MNETVSNGPQEELPNWYSEGPYMEVPYITFPNECPIGHRMW